MSKEKQFIKGLQQAWRDEMLSAKNYYALAEKEINQDRKKILIRMAEAEERHAERWAIRLKELGVKPAVFNETLQERIRRWILLRTDIATAAKIMEAAEAGADKLYFSLKNNALNESDISSLHEIQKEEKSHSKMMQEFEGNRKYHPETRLEKLLGREKWHVRSGGWIGQAIYGVNDGLGAAFGVVSGVAGATNANAEFVLLSGFATMLASALSMGSGAYLATKSEREVYEAEMEREKREIEENPEEEKEELELFYQLKGFSEAEAKQMADRLALQPEQMLKTLAHEELGLSEQSFPNPWRSAVSATISTAIGAIVPVIPFLFCSGEKALIISFIVSTVAHFAVGASKVIVTGRSWVKSGTEMMVIGIAAAAITYAIGLLISPMIG